MVCGEKKAKSNSVRSIKLLSLEKQFRHYICLDTRYSQDYHSIFINISKVRLFGCKYINSCNMGVKQTELLTCHIILKQDILIRHLHINVDCRMSHLLAIIGLTVTH